ncbi:MAG: hypothetical protein KatS3mg052_1646 [Candidatus Roseilinea sp.]|nr:MAG: hypothetical protein KatS3mg052_1646 [Candidatus Roseilinea sp.]
MNISKRRRTALAAIGVALLLSVALQFATQGRVSLDALLKQIAAVLLMDSGEAGAVVKRAVDGDTIVVEINGQEYRVRYIGVDAPESTSRQECYGKQAAHHNQSLVEGKVVRLERDVNDTDRYGRLLRYVYLPSGEMVNEVLIRDGYALARSFPPDVKYQDRLKAAEREARRQRRGLWRSCPSPGSTLWQIRPA